MINYLLVVLDFLFLIAEDNRSRKAVLRGPCKLLSKKQSRANNFIPNFLVERYFYQSESAAGIARVKNFIAID